MSDEIATGELDDFLATRYAKQIGSIREEINLCTTDAERYDLCVRTRDRLLNEHADVERLIAAADHLLCKECPQYQKWRKDKDARPRRDQDDAEQWDRFVGVAASGRERNSKCLQPLKEVSRIWGRDVVQHYELADLGEYVLNQWRALAKAIPDFSEAVVKLGKVELRRHHLQRRHRVAASVNPIEPIDLKNARAWLGKGDFFMANDTEKVALPYRKLTGDELPPGFGLDKYGLPVLEEFAAEQPKVGRTGDSGESEGRENSNNDEAEGSEGTDRANEAVVARSIPEDRPTPARDDEAGSTAAAHGTGSSRDISNPFEPLGDSTASGTSQSAADPSPRLPQVRATGVLTEAGGRDLRQRSKEVSYAKATGRSQAFKAKHPPRSSAAISRRCCPKEVPDMALSLLDGQSAFPETLEQLRRYQDQLCYVHLKKFAGQTAKIAFPGKTRGLTVAAEDQSTAVPSKRQRATSLPPDSGQSPTSKRHRDDSSRLLYALRARGTDRVFQSHDSVLDDAYRRQILSELTQKFAENKAKSGSHGEYADQLMLKILEKSTCPNTDGNSKPLEAYCLSGQEAARKVESESIEIPIFVNNQQNFQWDGNDRPIAELFRRIEDLDQTVSVQMPSLSSARNSFASRSLAQIQARFLAKESTDDPWNILDLRSPLPPGVLPNFLMGPNCQLLSRIRDKILMPGSGERLRASRDDWHNWRDDQEMVLLSEGGHNTGPHTDSDGKATWITVQEGQYLFVWMSRPTPQDWQEWVADPQYTGGQWRHKVLMPGQTVFFGPGLIHGVSRASNEQTLALSGHILQWSAIERWIEVLTLQMKNPHITNESMERTAEYIYAVKELVQSRVNNGRVEQLGGEDAAARIFSLIQGIEEDQKRRRGKGTKGRRA